MKLMQTHRTVMFAYETKDEMHQHIDSMTNMLWKVMQADESCLIVDYERTTKGDMNDKNNGAFGKHLKYDIGVALCVTFDELKFRHWKMEQECLRLREIFECIKRNTDNTWILERCEEALNPRFEA